MRTNFLHDLTSSLYNDAVQFYYQAAIYLSNSLCLNLSTDKSSFIFSQSEEIWSGLDYGWRGRIACRQFQFLSGRIAARILTSRQIDRSILQDLETGYRDRFLTRGAAWYTIRFSRKYPASHERVHPVDASATWKYRVRSGPSIVFQKRHSSKAWNVGKGCVRLGVSVRSQPDQSTCIPHQVRSQPLPAFQPTSRPHSAIILFHSPPTFSLSLFHFDYVLVVLDKNEISKDARADRRRITFSYGEGWWGIRWSLRCSILMEMREFWKISKVSETGKCKWYLIVRTLVFVYFIVYFASLSSFFR